ncbi:RraA family protein [Aspergillus tubingensis]|uniref:RraA-like protein n=1 Tax=Aspergillus costaricaensis CBS 115574 TaxID=1448317 RepID=A0ACD1IUC2_9EURO|nr:RraA-like protein [Aspergillus costaricaensis CBS 115574]XP_035362094.1 putative ribonuclease e inhibitor rraa dimethylmenaquinone methyltransferase protein [Aspergillus tubingensis]RAK94085.1 RraA-like protein [Aspergillus costaricaensis CBS 115574]GFN21290.1 putative ribonuclease e inhibitor rraa dimethylmenaquinone methyltransferase protein [Aspergillus tubingensis]
MAADSKVIIERLQKWGACDVADGLSKLKYPNGGFLEGLTMYSPEFQAGETKVVGQAFTVKFVPKSDEAAPKLQGNYIDQIPEGGVVFISQPLPHVNAVYGGLMTLRAQALKAAAVVIDGRVRDLEEHRSLNFPLFARSVGTTAGGEVCRPSEINVPVRLNSENQDAVISPGDYIIADLNGVVRLPQELAEQVLELIPAIAEADAKCAEAIKAGWTVERAFKEFRGR